MNVDVPMTINEPLQTGTPVSPEVAQRSVGVGQRPAASENGLATNALEPNDNDPGPGASTEAERGLVQGMEGVSFSQTLQEVNGQDMVSLGQKTPSNSSRKRKNDDLEEDDHERSTKRVATGGDNSFNLPHDGQQVLKVTPVTRSEEEDAEGDVDSEHHQARRSESEQHSFLNASGRPQRRAAATAGPKLSTPDAPNVVTRLYTIDDSGSGEEEKDDEEDELYADPPQKNDSMHTRSGTAISRGKPRRSRTGRAQNEIPAYAQNAYYAKPVAAPSTPQVLNKKSRGRLVPAKEDDGRKYKCTICSKVFARGEHLKRHVRSIHTDEKPYECPYPGCGRTFSRTDNMMQHMRTHTDWPEQPPAHLAAQAIKAGKASQQKLDALKKNPIGQDGNGQASTSNGPASSSATSQATQVASYSWFQPGTNPPPFVMLPIMGQATESTNDGSEKAEEDVAEPAEEKPAESPQPSTSKATSAPTKSTKSRGGKSKKVPAWATAGVSYAHTPFMMPAGGFSTQNMIPFYSGLSASNGNGNGNGNSKNGGSSSSAAQAPLYALPVQYPPGTQPAGLKLPPGVTPVMMIDPKTGMPMVMAAPSGSQSGPGWIPYSFVMPQTSNVPNSGKGKGKNKTKTKQGATPVKNGDGESVAAVPVSTEPTSSTRDVEDQDLMSEDEEEQSAVEQVQALPVVGTAPGNDEESDEESDSESDSDDSEEEN